MTDVASRANKYIIMLRRAEQVGFERGLRGEALEPCPYRREDATARYEEGWRRGVKQHDAAFDYWYKVKRKRRR